MKVISAADIGILIRSVRSDRKWSQTRLAQEIGATARCLRDVEHGKDTASIGLVLRALGRLDITIEMAVPGLRESPVKPPIGIGNEPDIDAILDGHR